jgi:hypothetical protein
MHFATSRIITFTVHWRSAELSAVVAQSSSLSATAQYHLHVCTDCVAAVHAQQHCAVFADLVHARLLLL